MNRTDTSSYLWNPVLKIVSLSLPLLLSGLLLEAGTLQVRHDHDPWGKCVGELEISQTGIEFKSKKEKHSRRWDWFEIQSFDRKSDQKFSILTWEDQTLLLGKDRFFDFTILPDGGTLSAEDFNLIRENLKGTVTDRLVREPFHPDYSLRVKHLHGMGGGCEGTLRFSPEWIVYETEQPGHSRTWKRDREIESVWSLHRYQLEIHAFEENQREFSKTRRFRFQLKEPLDQDYYEQMRRAFLPAR